MSVTGRTLKGVLFAATSAWVQLALAAITFGVVAHRLSPGEIGSYGLVTLLIGLIGALVGPAFAESLQQRKQIEPKHANATFWIGLTVAISAALALATGAGAIAEAASAPLVAPLMAWAAFLLPISTAAAVPNALLARDLRFAETARIGGLAAVLGAIVAITAILSGAGVWSLLLSELTIRTVALLCLWRASGFRPGPPRQLGAVADLMGFNTSSAAIYLLGSADRAAPRLLTGFLLGPIALGYLVVAQRLLDLLSQLVLVPLAGVTMAAVARVQDRRDELRRLVLALYRVAAICAYPAFIGAILLVPDLARLAGDKWLPAVPAAQILLLVGLRTTTGMFNLPVLRGLGDSLSPMILLGAGLALNLILIPFAAVWGVTGIAAAMLLRTLATWPVGCWFVRRATGIPIREQARAGWRSFAAAAGMGAASWLILSLMTAEAPLVRLIVGASIGIGIYALAFALLAPGARKAIRPAARLWMRGDRERALSELRSGFAV